MYRLWVGHGEPGGITLRRTTYKDPRTQLECVMELRQYADFPAAWWVVRFRNAGTKDTPILEDIQAIDTAWPNAFVMFALPMMP